MLTLGEVATELSSRLSQHLPAGRATVAVRATATTRAMPTDPHWRDLVLFHEYFHGDNGRGVGASHQTGWTALVVRCLETVAKSRSGYQVDHSERERGDRSDPGRELPLSGTMRSVRIALSDHTTHLPADVP